MSEDTEIVPRSIIVSSKTYGDLVRSGLVTLNTVSVEETVDEEGYITHIHRTFGRPKLGDLEIIVADEPYTREQVDRLVASWKDKL